MTKTNRNPQVDRFMAKLDYPRKAELEALREIFLSSSPDMSEVIKWSCPTFLYKGNLASLVVRTKKQAQVMFHQCALPAERGGLLVGEGETVRFCQFRHAGGHQEGEKAARSPDPALDQAEGW
jgi:uncharacterized protein YdeI (YjbR/CyaY-like superfamily)